MLCSADLPLSEMDAPLPSCPRPTPTSDGFFSLPDGWGLPPGVLLPPSGICVPVYALVAMENGTERISAGFMVPASSSVSIVYMAGVEKRASVASMVETTILAPVVSPAPSCAATFTVSSPR